MQANDQFSMAHSAHVAASAAAAVCGIRIVELAEMPQIKEAATLFRRIWQTGEAEQPVNSSLMRAMGFEGNYVVGGYAGSALVAAALAFRGASGLHSHIAGVDPQFQARGVGRALKLHQRAWALERGLTTINWTFDPLVRRNAYFNLTKLGVEATSYLPDFYGEMSDEINAGLPSDRIYATWHLDSPRAVAAAAGHHTEPDLDGTVILGRGLAGEPQRAGSVSGSRLLAAMPEEIERLRSTDPMLCDAWRLALREALMSTMDAGYRITGVSRSGWYVLEEPQ